MLCASWKYQGELQIQETSLLERKLLGIAIIIIIIVPPQAN